MPKARLDSHRSPFPLVPSPLGLQMTKHSSQIGNHYLLKIEAPSKCSQFLGPLGPSPPLPGLLQASTLISSQEV